MREIKFRAWDKEIKEMIRDIWIAPEYGWEVFSDNDAMCERERPKQGQIELMQYTGLKDKNGKEIYEGDIYRHTSRHGSHGSDRDLHEVKDLQEFFENKGLGEGEYGDDFSLIEIIGNIYKNPDLLKKGGE